MVISLVLTPEQQAWLDAHVASGDFTSVEAAARQLIAERIQEREAEEADDLTWAGPYIAEALEEAAGRCPDAGGTSCPQRGPPHGAQGLKGPSPEPTCGVNCALPQPDGENPDHDRR
ncbi:MAG TPA: hypothetical protein VE690_21270 [Rhodopila sp.]|nr:hypothetical protein [Rhodopila sp.]